MMRNTGNTEEKTFRQSAAEYLKEVFQSFSKNTSCLSSYFA